MMRVKHTQRLLKLTRCVKILRATATFFFSTTEYATAPTP